MRQFLALGLLFLPAFAGAEAQAATPPRPFSFALMGDMPYSEDEEPRVVDLLERINRMPIEFVVHIGDFKNGQSHCSDELFQNRLELFSRSLHPFIYTPGDNEWTDCNRWLSGGYDPVERLNRLRELFHANGLSLGQHKLPLERQSDNPRFASYRENVRWGMQGVLFVTLNVPGSNNNRGRSEESTTEYRERGAANRQWLKQAFELARRREILGLAIFFQADPGFEWMRSYKRTNGYRDLVAQLVSGTQALNKPVLLGHGDTHRFRVDRPLLDVQTGATIPGLLRVETFGSPFIDWVSISVDPADPQLFRVQPGS